MGLLNLFKKKKEEPELITEYDLLKAIEEKLTPEEFAKFIELGGHKRLNSYLFFYNEEED